MDLINKLKEDIHQAVKKGDKSLANSLKYLLSLLQTEAARKKDFDEKEAVKTLQKEMKSKKEAFKLFKKAGRKDLSDREKEEIKILEKYLPEMMTKDEIKKIVKEVVNNADELEMGKIIGQVMARVKGKAEGSQVAEIVKEMI